ncbi:hypothetical protein METH_22560 (plasmid) [Leisingera methylohalidivorans DSM 14336]|uniref:Uncharacterized protein n=1 Tax=Leisingera methylohalidivorans DSM 14336 TaxID=999552 RepID=V9W0T3_9RHOB|nr:hypothetical protein METH_12005 [Leisingera methylohalidivorans DSM 14336]AHD03614.1 hypothetical protein METH_22560 [Leisingera methylohalidivorans DSM 14336]
MDAKRQTNRQQQAVKTAAPALVKAISPTDPANEG